VARLQALADDRQTDLDATEDRRQELFAEHLARATLPLLKMVQDHR
jgi:hypothetical protein